MIRSKNILKKLTAAGLCGILTISGATLALASENQSSAQLMDVLTSSTTSNVVISPYSIRMALSMLAEGAVGETRDELEAFLGSYAQKLDLEDDVPFHSANSFWMTEGFVPNEDYVKVLQEQYEALVESMDFSAPEAPDRINQWVNDQTNGLISNLVDPSIASMSAILVNALYYHGAWQEPFDDFDITMEDFHSPNGTETAVMLNGYGDGWDYFENDQATGFRIFYEDGFQFIGLLPNEEEFQFADLDLDSFLASNDLWCTKNVSLYYQLPEFKAEYSQSLRDALAQCGVVQSFSDSADFSGIADALKANDVIHKTYIDVNREGTEAAAVTGILMEAMAMAPEETEEIIYKEVILDRPFVFMILEPLSGELIFLGQINTVAE